MARGVQRTLPVGVLVRLPLTYPVPSGTHLLIRFSFLFADVEPPKIDCPKNMTIPTETEVNFATVKLSLPNTTDNSGSDPVIWSKPPFEEQHPLRLTIGETKVEIYSVDEAGNYGFCQFTVFVTGEVIDMTKGDGSPPMNSFLIT